MWARIWAHIYRLLSEAIENRLKNFLSIVIYALSKKSEFFNDFQFARAMVS